MTDSDNIWDHETLLREIETSWNELQGFIASLTEAQQTEPTDAAGWTVKDHLMHIAKWEEAGTARLSGTSKRESMEVAPEIWEQGDDPINAVIQERYQDLPLHEVLEFLHQSHERMLAKLNSMTDADLRLPFSHYQPDSTYDRPIIWMIIGDTIEHYRDHLPWMAAIAENA